MSEQSERLPLLKVGDVIEGRWKVVSKLGEGSFGAVYEAVKIKGSWPFYKENPDWPHMALKIESNKCAESDQCLKVEKMILEALKGSTRCCTLYGSGKKVQYNFLLMSLLGPSLESLRDKTDSKCFTMSTSIKLLYECSKAVQDVHEAGFLHRDLKPGNFAIGRTPETKRRIYIFDFGLARMFKSANGSLRPCRPRHKVGFRGTCRYASINAHFDEDLGRHDDLITLLYMVVEMVAGHLPWYRMEDEEEVPKCKQALRMTLFDSIRQPRLLEMQEYLYSLSYEDKPDYNRFDRVAMDIIRENRYERDPYDWESFEKNKKYDIYDKKNSALCRKRKQFS